MAWTDAEPTARQALEECLPRLRQVLKRPYEIFAITHATTLPSVRGHSFQITTSLRHVEGNRIHTRDICLTLHRHGPRSVVLQTIKTLATAEFEAQEDCFERKPQYEEPTYESLFEIDTAGIASTTAEFKTGATEGGVPNHPGFVADVLGTGAENIADLPFMPSLPNDTAAMASFCQKLGELTSPLQKQQLQVLTLLPQSLAEPDTIIQPLQDRLTTTSADVDAHNATWLLVDALVRTQPSALQYAVRAALPKFIALCVEADSANHQFAVLLAGWFDSSIVSKREIEHEVFRLSAAAQDATAPAKRQRPDYDSPFGPWPVDALTQLAIANLRSLSPANCIQDQREKCMAWVKQNLPEYQPKPLSYALLS
eukprot:TRINITY_DN42219_c0_g1_i1.p1 TRINITY_DN42219_c0_g1~~TRINITY_DN42219_c0_g1_i1.p1  ORF type:complete len:369 (+),score=53.49 TRINITY_DN42219_c0_g1_i1:29-1135(+)